ncbi:general transcription factor II-I repeat domain-containing protein 2A-like [Scylla paramamosain]|uniref:general transcription factor II-I repeat domain-containing protein 2A-like n=1 Tax=Scylla paramamosain TaxID=85552 RepID=UPI0030830542
MHESIRAFEVKLKLFERQLAANNAAHFPTLKSLQSTPEFRGIISREKYRNMISKLLNEFGERFADLKNLESDFSIFRNPFAANPDETPEDIQLELIDLHTYVCEQLFSLMNLNKSGLRSRLTNEHLNSTLKVAIAQSLAPNIDELVQTKRCQVSGSSTTRN